jgi:oxygen-independent coproporphyrinogen-3 oxidase
MTAPHALQGAPLAGVLSVDEPMHAEHVYVHVPFCARRCSYCDFSIAVRRVVPARAFADGIAREMTVRALSGGRISTLYFGGGTPSRLGGDGVSWLMDTMTSRFAPTPAAEITLEANPEDVSLDAVRAWVRAGINRVSLGVQSFDDRVLQWMHRTHSADTITRAVETLRDAGISELSVDLIFAVPEQLARDWTRDVEAALALEVPHLSVYGLTVESGTPLGRWTSRGDTIEAPEQRYEAEFLEASTRLRAAGYAHYEVSNYARPGHQARHNSAYWRLVPYLGVGPSAHGFDGDERRWNQSAYAAWLQAVERGDDPVEGREPSTADIRASEAIYLGLRTEQGLAVCDTDAMLIAPWQAAGWVTVDAEGILRCTPAGWLRLDTLATALTVHRSRY